MKLHGHKRLDVFIPIAQWEVMEAAREGTSRSQYVRDALWLIAYRDGHADAEAPSAPAKAKKKASPAKTPRELLQERTRLMRRDGG